MERRGGTVQMRSRHTWIWMEACSFESAGDRRGRGGEVAGSRSGEGSRPQAARVRVPGEKTRKDEENLLAWAGGDLFAFQGPGRRRRQRGLKDPSQQEDRFSVLCCVSVGEEKKVRSVRGVALRDSWVTRGSWLARLIEPIFFIHKRN